MNLSRVSVLYRPTGNIELERECLRAFSSQDHAEIYRLLAEAGCDFGQDKLWELLILDTGQPREVLALYTAYVQKLEALIGNSPVRVLAMSGLDPESSRARALAECKYPLRIELEGGTRVSPIFVPYHARPANRTLEVLLDVPWTDRKPCLKRLIRRASHPSDPVRIRFLCKAQEDYSALSSYLRRISRFSRGISRAEAILGRSGTDSSPDQDPYRGDPPQDTSQLTLSEITGVADLDRFLDLEVIILHALNAGVLGRNIDALRRSAFSKRSDLYLVVLSHVSDLEYTMQNGCAGLPWRRAFRRVEPDCTLRDLHNAAFRAAPLARNFVFLSVS